MTILQQALNYKSELDDETQERLRKLETWDFSQLIEDMTPRLLLEEGRVFSVEQMLPILLHFAQVDNDLKRVAQKILMPLLQEEPYSQRASGLDSDFVDQACEQVKQRVTDIATEFKRFVAISLVEPDVVHAPSGPVDMFWHFLLLHTAEYQEFCEEVWGSHKLDQHLAA